MKKRIIIILGTVIIIVALMAMFIFVFWDGNNDKNQKAKNIEGTWRVVSSIEKNQVSLLESEFYIFSKNNVKKYKDGEEKPYVESKYELDNNNNLILSETSQQYVMVMVTENIIALYENEKDFMYLIKYPNAAMSEKEEDMTVLDGSWTIICHGGNTMIDEKFIFHDGILDYYKNGETKPAASFTYSLDKNSMFVEELSLNVMVLKITDSCIIFVETNTGYVWELEKQK